MGLSNKDAQECATIVDQYLMRFKETFGHKPRLSELADRLEKELASRKELEFKPTFGDLSAESLEHCSNMIKACAIAEDNALKPKETYFMPMVDENTHIIRPGATMEITNAQAEAVVAVIDQVEQMDQKRFEQKPKKSWNPLK